MPKGQSGIGYFTPRMEDLNKKKGFWKRSKGRKRRTASEVWMQKGKEKKIV
jgi:hypothetical protein